MARPRNPESQWRPPNTVVDHGIVYHRPTRTRLGTLKDHRSLIWKRYEDMISDGNPPLTSEQLARLRPAQEDLPGLVKVAVSIHLDPDIIDWYRATGRGWEGRINEVLRAAMDGGG